MRYFMRIWKEPRTGIHMLALPFVPMILVCLHMPLPEHLITQQLPESPAHTNIAAINPLPKPIKGKQCKRKYQASESLPGTPWRTCIQSRE
jgi:hypothetical protein